MISDEKRNELFFSYRKGKDDVDFYTYLYQTAKAITYDDYIKLVYDDRIESGNTPLVNPKLSNISYRVRDCYRKLCNPETKKVPFRFVLKAITNENLEYYDVYDTKKEERDFYDEQKNIIYEAPTSDEYLEFVTNVCQRIQDLEKDSNSYYTYGKIHSLKIFSDAIVKNYAQFLDEHEKASADLMFEGLYGFNKNELIYTDNATLKPSILNDNNCIDLLSHPRSFVNFPAWTNKDYSIAFKAVDKSNGYDENLYNFAQRIRQSSGKTDKPKLIELFTKIVKKIAESDNAKLTIKVNMKLNPSKKCNINKVSRKYYWYSDSKTARAISKVDLDNCTFECLSKNLFIKFDKPDRNTVNVGTHISTDCCVAPIGEEIMDPSSVGLSSYSTIINNIKFSTKFVEYIKNSINDNMLRKYISHEDLSNGSGIDNALYTIDVEKEYSFSIDIPLNKLIDDRNIREELLENIIANEVK